MDYTPPWSPLARPGTYRLAAQAHGGFRRHGCVLGKQWRQCVLIPRCRSSSLKSSRNAVRSFDGPKYCGEVRMQKNEDAVKSVCNKDVA